MTNKKKLVRVAAVPQSLKLLLKGQLQFLNDHFEVVGVASPGKMLEEVRQQEGIRTVPVEIKRNIDPLSDLKSLYVLYRLFKKEKPEMVHSITPKAGLLSMTAAYFARVPIRMHTFTGLIFPSKTGIFRQLLLLMDRLTCFFATNAYPEGEGVKQDLINAKVTKKPLKVLANGNVNGIDLAHFHPAEISKAQQSELKKSLVIAEDDFVFIFVGRLTRDKGINELIRAFQTVNKKLPKTKLVLLGNYEKDLDPIETETEREIENNPTIHFAGYQNDVRPYFTISDALVFPSYREGFPNVVMQAGAMGLPSIVTDINGCNEIIIEGKNGTIVPSKNVQALSKAMQRMFEDNEWRKQLQQNAREMIVSRYEQKMVWEALLSEYKTLEKEINAQKNT